MTKPVIKFSKLFRTIYNFTITVFFLQLLSTTTILSSANASERSLLQLTDLGAGAALPAFGSDNAVAGFQKPGTGFIVNYFANPVTSPTTGIVSAMASITNQRLGAQLGLGIGSGYLTLAPGLSVRFPSVSLQFGVITDLQFNSFAWNNVKISMQVGNINQWILGARTTISYVSGFFDSYVVGIAKNYQHLQVAADLEVDGTFGTFRLWPGLGLTLGNVKLGITGAIARANNWAFYLDRLKMTAALELGSLAFLKLTYETPYLVSLGAGILL
jgi:hypothetical protein